MHDPTISVESNRFLLIGFQPWEGVLRALLFTTLLFHSPMRPSTSLGPHQAISQNHMQKFPISLSVLKPAVQTGLHPLWKVHLWVSELPSSHSSSFLQVSGSGVHCTQPPCSGSRRHVLCYPGSWWSPGRHMSQDSDFSVCPSQKQKSVAQYSWSQFSSAPNTSHESVLG